jgi:hypothetical protein
LINKCNKLGFVTSLQLCRDTHPQRVELDEATCVGLIVGTFVVLEGGDGRVEQRIGLGIAAGDDDVALVKFQAHPAVDVGLRMVDQHLQRLALRAPPVAVIDK